MAIFDQFGRAIEKRWLTKEIARAETSGVRPAIYDAVSNGLTPARLANILRTAVEGDAVSYLSLAEEMEERYLHYRGVLYTRKSSVSGATLSVEPLDESPRAQEIADACSKHVVKRSIFRSMLFDLLDALGKSYSVVEPIWYTASTPWTYKAFEWRDQRWFHYDRVTQRELRLRNQNNPDGDPLPGGAFVVHTPKIKSGLPIRGGLARVAAIAYMISMYTLKDWLAYMEVFGMPLRLGKYDPDRIKEPERLTLRTALANLGHDAAAMIPEGMDIEIVDVNRGTAGPLFSSLADYVDKQVSKGVLGQTMTTDDGASLSQARVHGEVKQDIRVADATDLTATVQEGIIRPWCQLNYGEDAPICRFLIDVEPPEDLKTFTETVLPWVERGGLRVGAGFIRDKFGIPDPVEDQETEILEAVPKAPVSFGRPLPADGEPALSSQSIGNTSVLENETETLVDNATSEWRRIMSPQQKAVSELANACNSYEEFKSRLGTLIEQFNSDPFLDMLVSQMFKARGLGDTQP